MVFIREQSHHRREWFRTIGRILSLIGLTMIGAIAFRKQDNTPNNNPCIQPSHCQGCGIFSNCSLPQAIQARRDKKEKHHG